MLDNDGHATKRMVFTAKTALLFRIGTVLYAKGIAAIGKGTGEGIRESVCSQEVAVGGGKRAICFANKPLPWPGGTRDGCSGAFPPG